MCLVALPPKHMPSLALDYISIRGFKSIASIDKLPLKPVNVLIGSNGSGKSNFIGLFSFLHAVREGRLRDTSSGWRRRKVIALRL